MAKIKNTPAWICLCPKVLLNNCLNEGYNPDYSVTHIGTKYLITTGA